jgi:uncharacterized protein involved in exopolysaccharide biosynthesis
MSFLEFLRLLRRNYRLILLSGLLTAGLVAVLTAWRQPEYRSEAMIYTGIASGYTLEKQEAGRTDYYAVNNAFDNLLNIIQSRHTLEESALRLLARHALLEAPEHGVMEASAFEQLREAWPPRERAGLVVSGDAEATLHRLRLAYRRDTGSVVRRLLRITPGPYHLDRLREIRPVRKNNSDMIQLSYTAADPGIARQTLAEVLDVFTRKFHELKTSETGEVIGYFERQVAEAETRLNEAEARLARYRSGHGIINYSEQTKFIAEKHEDALEMLHQTEQELKARKAALAEIERKLAVRAGIYHQNDTLLALKSRLADAQAQLTLLRTATSVDPRGALLRWDTASPTQRLRDSLQSERRAQALNRDIRGLEERLAQAARRRYRMEHGPEGAPAEPLLQQWVGLVVEKEKYRAKADYFSERLAAIDGQYKDFAPLGSELTRLERSIDVAERAYLENLHSLNMARLRKQNLRLSSRLRVVDPPNYPVEPLPGKRKLLVVVGMLLGLSLSTATLTAMELFDQSLNHPERAADAVGLTPTGALPGGTVRDDALRRQLRPMLARQLLSRCRLLLPIDQDRWCVGVVSTRPGEGKTSLLQALVQETALQEDEPGQAATLWREWPALITQPLTAGQAQGVDLWVLVARTDRRWSPADAQALAWLRRTSDKPIVLVLNGLSLHHLDHFLGDVPRRRNSLRRRLKRLAHLEFSSNLMPSTP